MLYQALATQAILVLLHLWPPLEDITNWRTFPCWALFNFKGVHHTFDLEGGKKALFIHISSLSRGLQVGQCNLMRPQNGVCENEYIIILSHLETKKPLITSSGLWKQRNSAVERLEWKRKRSVLPLLKHILNMMRCGGTESLSCKSQVNTGKCWVKFQVRTNKSWVKSRLKSLKSSPTTSFI